MTRRVAVFTGTRADYGLLRCLIREIAASPRLQLRLIAAAAHFSPEFGDTWRDIEDDGVEIDARVEMLLSSDSAVGVVKSVGVGLIGLADALDRLRPDLLVVLGDRFEALAAAQAALLMRIPIAHIHGGEITEGAYDDAIRHAITKMATLHFVAAEPYRRRVIQMGEQPGTVFTVGAPGLENLRHDPVMSLDALGESLAFDLRPGYFLATFHPATQSDEVPEAACQAMLAAIARFPERQLLLTYPNADDGGRGVIRLLEAHAAAAPQRVIALRSLGARRYPGALAHAALVIGNSSSGIIEAPAFQTPSVDIGDRQRGRLAADSVLRCEPDVESITAAITRALSEEHRARCRDARNPYGDGRTAEKIVHVLERFEPGHAKRFHDLSAP